jgi:hypothetical protein
MLKFKCSFKKNFISIFLVLILVFILFSSTLVYADDVNADYDSDGLNDIYEDYLGSDYTDSTDVLTFTISDSNYYLVDVLKDGVYDNFCSPLNGYYSDVGYANNVPLLDYDGDEKWDYKYQNGQLVEYNRFFDDFFNNYFNTIWFYIIVIVAVIVSIVLILFKKGILFLYEEEYIIEK